jgi:hypothetical protein
MQPSPFDPWRWPGRPPAAAARIYAPLSSEWVPDSVQKEERPPAASEREIKKLEQRAAQGSGAGCCLFRNPPDFPQNPLP